jgi:hypothetical protein
MTFMKRYVDITFDCLPLRSVGRFDPPIDATDEQVEFYDRLRRAATKHGLHNSYYLYRAACVFHLTNDAEIGMVEFAFEGTVLTDTDDLKTRQCDLEVRLQREVCEWLTAPAVTWLAETVREAVVIEFDRYIAAGDLNKTIERMERLRAESEAQGGFLGMGL